MKKIIYISGSPIWTTYGKKLGVEWFLDNNVEVEFWDLTSIYYEPEKTESYFSNHLSFKYKFPMEKIFYSKNKFYNELQSIPPSFIFCFVDFSHLDYYWILRSFKRNEVNYFTHPMSTPMYTGRYSNLGLVSKIKESIRGRVLIDKIKKTVLSKTIKKLQYLIYKKTNYYKKPVFSMGSGVLGSKYWHEIMQPGLFFSVPSTDVIWNLLPPLLDEKYCVYIDEAMLNSPDSALFGGTTSMLNDNNIFFNELNCLFDRIEKHMKCPVVIAASGKYRYSDRSIFKGRRIIYSDTCKLIQGSSLVVGHKSQALLQAVVNTKPIMLVTSQSMVEVKNRHIVGMAKILGLPSTPMKDVDSYYLDSVLNYTYNYSGVVEQYLCNIADCKKNWKIVAFNQINKINI